MHFMQFAHGSIDTKYSRTYGGYVRKSGDIDCRQSNKSNRISTQCRVFVLNSFYAFSNEIDSTLSVAQN